jgi:hypothetical protein
VRPLRFPGGCSRKILSAEFGELSAEAREERKGAKSELAAEPSPFALMARGHLYSWFALTLLRELGVAIFHAQAYIPT